MSNTVMPDDIKVKIQLEAEKEEIYEPKYGGKDHSGYNTMMLYEVNDERSECFEKGAIYGYSLAAESLAEKDLIIHGLEEGSDNWKAEYDNCRTILQELVDLKNIKDLYGARVENYETRKPLAWEKAREFLKKYQHL